MEREAFAAEIVSLLHDVLQGNAYRREIADRLESIAKSVRDGAEKKRQLSLDGNEEHEKTKAGDTSQKAVERVFAYWRKRTGKTKAKLLAERAAKIRNRLRNFTEGELKVAIDGALQSEFHVEHDHLDLLTLFKNGTTVEKHIERMKGVGGRGEDADIAALRAQMDEARSNGDVETFNALNRRLKDALASG